MPETTMRTDDAAAPAENPSAHARSGEGPPLVFDLELERGPEEVGGWKHVERMGVAVAVVQPFVGAFKALGEPMVFRADELELLQEVLDRARFVVGWNHVGFDYRVLKGRGYPIRQRRNVDLCAALRRATGRLWSLGDVAESALGEDKGLDSADLPKLWRRAFEDTVIEACKWHVELTGRIWQALAEAPGRITLPGARVVNRWQLRRRGARLSY